ncbi:hypothetical protein ABID56_001006 [Alkalibacillus flavidus]|uniref:Uncharacterized protein n=1 Tax=Alkalibacillus flavidus TaxID=546021 RepID=A0ABV2KWH1_9BACI
MNTKIYIFLLVILGVNILRYGTYILEGGIRIYDTFLFLVNLIAFITVIVYTTRIVKLSETL